MFSENHYQRKHQKKQNSLRVWVVLLFVLFCFSLLLYRLFVLQVVRSPSFIQQADSNRITYVPIVPKRGDIFDRKGRPLAYSQRDYTLEIVPEEVKHLDDLLTSLKTLIPISDFELRRFKRRRYASRSYERVLLKTSLTEEQAAEFSENAIRFPGVYLNARWLRVYPQGETAAHVVGYVGRLSDRDHKKLEEDGLDSEYKGTDVIGKSGIEAFYEQTLHGKTGWRKVEVDSAGRLVRELSRQEPVPGDHVYLSIDLDLQSMVEQLFRQSKEKGALVAMNPNTGGVLAYVSMPSYDPNLFIDGIDSTSWALLRDDPDHPLLNRPIAAKFPIGSTYKPFVGLAAMYYKVRNPYAYERDIGYFEYGHQRFRNAGGAAYGKTNMYKAITVSSDTYFFSLGPLLGVDRLHDFALQFGFGKKTGIDLRYEKRGTLPSKAWKKKAFKNPRYQKWIPGETISVTVGQGYNAFTMMQLAQATSTLASEGAYYTPHLMQFTYNDFLKKKTSFEVNKEYQIELDPSYLGLMKRAMINVTRKGTASVAFKGAPYVSAGKTGTAQIFSLKGAKYKKKELKKSLQDHALYMGYAPANEPKIALALIVENGGWGAQVAAPIAREVFDYWLARQDTQDVHVVLDTETQDTSLGLSAGEEVDVDNIGNDAVESLDASEKSPDVYVPVNVPVNSEDRQEGVVPEVIDHHDPVLPTGDDS